jgi:dTDP-4-dehydrorhamnose 3,5-epimerase-like enzyme
VGLDEVANCHPITLQHIDGATSGSLTVAEYGGAIPFEFRRVYYMTGVSEPGAVRGRHAHKTLQQAMFCVNGSVRLDVDDGSHKASVVLDRPHEGVYIGPLLWHELHEFSPGCVVLVFAAAEYDEEDYIRDYGAFLEFVKDSAKP